MKIPAFDLESRVLLVAATVVLLAVLLLSHRLRLSDSGIAGMLLFLAVLLANFVVSSRHAAAATALSFLCFALLCWSSPPAGNSPPATILHNCLLAFFGAGFAVYTLAAGYALFRPRAKAQPARRALDFADNSSAQELSGATLERGR